jgi:hypothetical protein
MVYFQTKNPNLGKFLALDRKMPIYYMSIWNILRTFWIIYDHWVHFVIIWYIFSSFGTLCQEKSGNPVANLAPVLRVQFRVKGFHVFGRVLFALECASQTGKLKRAYVRTCVAASS